MDFRPKLYFNVPFSLKDQVKENGCFWDPNFRQWYLPYHRIATHKNKVLSIRNDTEQVTISDSFGYYQPVKKDINKSMFV